MDASVLCEEQSMSKSLFGRVPLASVTTAIKDGTHGTHSRVSGGVPFLSAKNISSAGSFSWNESDDCIAESEFQQIQRYFQLQPRDILLTIVGSIGRRAVFDGSKVTFQRSVAYVRPDTRLVSERFLFHWFAQAEFQQELARRSNSTAQAGLYLGELAKTLVPDCPMPEQVRIAEILDTLDTTLRQTEAIIAKLKQVKQGLLHDLLTRGIDANGELRPPQSQAPHLYKDSPLGWIPREWEVVPTMTCCTLITKGTTPASDDMWQGNDGVRFLRVDNLSFDGQFAFEASRFRVSAATHRTTLGRSMCFPGDVLTNIVGPPLGKLGLVTDQSGDININQAIALFRANDDLLPRFLLLWLGSAIAQSWLRQRAKQTSGQVNLTLALCQELPLAFMDLAEQKGIISRVAAAQDRVDLESRELAKLVELKSGLMDDLLTGRVRVTPLLAPAAP